jgi:hypothetical protein
MKVFAYASTQGNLKCGRPVKMLLTFASTVAPGFSLLEIREQDLFSPRHVRVSKWGLLFDEVGVGLSM